MKLQTPQQHGGPCPRERERGVTPPVLFPGQGQGSAVGGEWQGTPAHWGQRILHSAGHPTPYYLQTEKVTFAAEGPDEETFTR